MDISNYLIDCIQRANGNLKAASRIANYSYTGFFKLLKKHNVEYKHLLSTANRALIECTCIVCNLRFMSKSHITETCNDCDELNERQLKELDQPTSRKCRLCNGGLPKSRYFSCKVCIPFLDTEDAFDDADDVFCEFDAEELVEVRKCVSCHEFKALAKFYKNGIRFSKNCKECKPRKRYEKTV